MNGIMTGILYVPVCIMVLYGVQDHQDQYEEKAKINLTYQINDKVKVIDTSDREFVFYKCKSEGVIVNQETEGGIYMKKVLLNCSSGSRALYFYVDQLKKI